MCPLCRHLFAGRWQAQHWP